jgi:two-component system, LytTR family, sensor kinase
MDASIDILKSNDSQSNQRSRFNWFFKYKIYHLPFWFAYHTMWWTLTLGSISAVFNNIFYSPYAFKFLFAVIFQAIGVYFNLYYLVPRFLEKGKYVKYLGLLLATILCTASLLVVGYYFAAWASVQTFEELFKMKPDNYMYIFKANSLSSTVASMTLAMSVKLAKNWIEAKKKQQLLEKEKLETELKFLRSQFNPHFLFNTINSIFVLIHKNPAMASDALVKFSDLLRYQLYECNEAEIPLQQEVSYLTNFIELQELRHNADRLKLSVEINSATASDLTIAPFVLIPFIENAFKHVSQDSGRNNFISIRLQMHEQLLEMSVSNSASYISANSAHVDEHKGIGLINVQRRLALIYPNDHKLDIVTKRDEFAIDLKLKLKQQRHQKGMTESHYQAEVVSLA